MRSISSAPNLYSGDTYDTRCGKREGLSIADGRRRREIVPVEATGKDQVLANVETVEPEVDRAEGPILVEERSELVGNTKVERSFSSRETADVEIENVESCLELLEDDRLDFDLANLREDNPDGSSVQLFRLRTVGYVLTASQAPAGWQASAGQSEPAAMCTRAHSVAGR